MKTTLNVLYSILFILVTFPGFCLLTSFVLVLSGTMNIEQGSKLASFGFELYGIK